MDEKQPNTESQKVINELLDGRDTVLKALYPLYLDMFVSWSRSRSTASEEDAVDAYQDGIIIFYEKVMSGQIKSLNCSVKTYVFTVSWRALLQRHGPRANKSHQISLSAPPDFDRILESLEEEKKEYIDEQKAADAFAKLSPTCQKLLDLYIFRGYDAKKVAKEMGYSDENGARVQKNRCLEKLKELIK